MRVTSVLRVVAALFVVAGLAMGQVAWAAESVVLRVVVVETADAQAYMKEIDRGEAIMKRLGSQAVIRVWKARWAGPESGSVVASIEYPSLTALAQDEARFTSDPELSAWLKGLDKFRKVVSDSLYYEMK